MPLQSENRLPIYELYDDQAALDAHASAGRIKARRERTGSLAAERKLHIRELKDSGDA